MNLRRRNWNMRAVDMDIFPDLNLLEWREGGIVPSTASLKSDDTRVMTGSNLRFILRMCCKSLVDRSAPPFVKRDKLF